MWGVCVGADDLFWEEGVAEEEGEVGSEEIGGRGGGGGGEGGLEGA